MLLHKKLHPHSQLNHLEALKKKVMLEPHPRLSESESLGVSTKKHIKQLRTFFKGFQLAG